MAFRGPDNAFESVSLNGISLGTLPFIQTELSINRNYFLEQLKARARWDIIIIGGGATGLGIAVDAASRGFATLLLEQGDFAQGTSSKSTKLVHGGVRYLAQGNIQLVFSALRERGLLSRNAPHLVQKQMFCIPCYGIWEAVKYYTGLKLYDWLAGNLSFGSSQFLRTNAVVKRFPTIKNRQLTGAVTYFDGQFDDARLAINLATTAVREGAVVLNYCKVTGLGKEEGKITGVVVTDLESNKEYHLKAAAVINATGVFADDVVKMDDPEEKPLIRTSQGAHVVVGKKFLNSESALLVPKTSDGRVLFAVPWHEHIIIGTTDTPVSHATLAPKPFQEEISFILESFNQYSQEQISRKDILAVFAGLRPLVMPNSRTKQTREISRDHKVVISASGLVTVLGGKWTTYRKMAEDAVNTIIKNTGLSKKRCITKRLKIHGYMLSEEKSHWQVYGSDAAEIKKLFEQNNEFSSRLVTSLPYTKAEVVWAVRYEMARTVEDVLARRLRLLFLDVKAAISAAPIVAEILRMELQQSEEWKEEQLAVFLKLADQYMPGHDSSTYH